MTNPLAKLVKLFTATVIIASLKFNFHITTQNSPAVLLPIDIMMKIIVTRKGH